MASLTDVQLAAIAQLTHSFDASGVEHGKVKRQLRMSYLRLDLDRTRCELHLLVVDNIHVTQPCLIGVNGTPLFVAFKERTDGVVCRNPGQIQHRRAYEVLIDFATVSEFWNIAVNQLKTL